MSYHSNEPHHDPIRPVQRAQALAGVGFNGETQRGIVTETNQVLAHARVDRTARGGVQRVVQIE